MLPIAVWPAPRLASCAVDAVVQLPGCRLTDDVGGVVGEVIGVVAAAVPDRHEDGVAAGRGLRDAVDGLLPGRRIPLVDGVAVVGVVVGAVHVLQRRDVIHHQRLREAPGRVGEALRGRRPDIGAVAHHRVFERIGADRHCAERTRHVLRMLEPEQMPGLVHDGQPGVVAEDRVVVPAARIVEPGVAAFGRGRRIVAPGRARLNSTRRSATSRFASMSR